MKEIKLYHIDDDYIKYLSQYQSHIWFNKEDSHTRPYLGVVFLIDEYKYYVPLCSYKEHKHGNLIDRLDLKIILDRGSRKIAVFNGNNMIPVDDSLVTLIDVDNEERKYKDLLISELAYLRGKKEKLLQDQEKVYNLVINYPHDNRKLVDRCYDFLKLEQKLKEYLNN